MTDAEALVFVVDDDASLRASLQDLLESVGLRVAACASAQDFLHRPRPEVPSCLVLDVRLPGLSGLELQQRMAVGDLAMPIIFITGHGDIPMSVQAMKAGAVDFLPKPFRDQDCSTPCTGRSPATAPRMSSGQIWQSCATGLTRSLRGSGT